MKKQLLALAVATGVAAIPATAAAEAILYGKVAANVSYHNIWVSENVKAKGWQHSQIEGTPTTRFGFKGSEEINPDLKAIYQIELGVPLAGSKGGLGYRNTYIGLTGESWGTFLAGRYDSPIKSAAGDFDLFGDDIGVKDPLGYKEDRFSNVLAYVSPDLSGFQIAAAAVSGNRLVSEETNRKNTAKGLADGWAVAATFNQNVFKAFAGYERVTKRLLEKEDNNLNTWTVGLGVFDLENFTAFATYERQSLGSAKRDIWQTQLGYRLGNTLLKGAYGESKIKNGAKNRLWSVGLDHNLSERTVANLAFAQHDIKKQKTGDWNGISIGLSHSF